MKRWKAQGERRLRDRSSRPHRSPNRLPRHRRRQIDRFVVMYSGNAGLGHRFWEVLGAMERLSGHPEVFFLFVGDGLRRAEIEVFAERRGIENFAYRDYVPRERLAQSLSVGDLHLVTLKPAMAGVAAPGKMYGILAAGRRSWSGPGRASPAW